MDTLNRILIIDNKLKLIGDIKRQLELALYLAKVMLLWWFLKRLVRLRPTFSQEEALLTHKPLPSKSIQLQVFSRYSSSDYFQKLLLKMQQKIRTISRHLEVYYER